MKRRTWRAGMVVMTITVETRPGSYRRSLARVVLIIAELVRAHADGCVIVAVVSVAVGEPLIAAWP
jgi:hypothetical protein